MDITLAAFTPIEESLFLTLCGRALDYRSPHSILSDMMAEEIVRKLDYDCERFRLSASPIINIALRAKKLDEVALRFAIWAAKRYHGTQSVADLIKSPGFDDPREPERWNPSLRLVEEILLTREPEVAQFPPVLRLITRLSAYSAALSRRGTTVLHYRF